MYDSDTNTFLTIVQIIYFAVYMIGLWILFKKAGEKGWKAIIPFYNSYTLIKIAELNWWYFIILISGTILSRFNLGILTWIITIISYIVNFFIFYNLAKKMNQKPIIVAVIGTFIPGIVISILGLIPKFQYHNNIIVSPNGPITNKNTI